MPRTNVNREAKRQSLGIRKRTDELPIAARRRHDGPAVERRLVMHDTVDYVPLGAYAEPARKAQFNDSLGSNYYPLSAHDRPLMMMRRVESGPLASKGTKRGIEHVEVSEDIPRLIPTAPLRRSSVESCDESEEEEGEIRDGPGPAPPASSNRSSQIIPAAPVTRFAGGTKKILYIPGLPITRSSKIRTPSSVPGPLSPSRCSSKIRSSARVLPVGGMRKIVPIAAASPIARVSKIIPSAPATSNPSVSKITSSAVALPFSGGGKITASVPSLPASSGSIKFGHPALSSPVPSGSKMSPSAPSRDPSSITTKRPRVLSTAPSALKRRARPPAEWHNICYEGFVDRFGDKHTEVAKLGVVMCSELDKEKEADKALANALRSIFAQRTINAEAEEKKEKKVKLAAAKSGSNSGSKMDEKQAVPIAEPLGPFNRPPTVCNQFDLGPGSKLARTEALFRKECQKIPARLGSDTKITNGVEAKGPSGHIYKLPSELVVTIIETHIARPWYYKIFCTIVRAGPATSHYKQAFGQLKEDTETLKSLAQVSRKMNKWTMTAVLKEVQLIGAGGRDLLLDTRRSFRLTVREQSRGRRHNTLLPILLVKGLKDSLFGRLASLDMASCTKNLPDALANGPGLTMPTLLKLAVSTRQIGSNAFRGWVGNLERLEVLHIIDQEPEVLVANVLPKANAAHIAASTHVGPDPPTPVLREITGAVSSKGYMPWDRSLAPSDYTATLTTIACRKPFELQITCKENRAMDALMAATRLAPNLVVLTLDLWTPGRERAHFWPDFARRSLSQLQQLKRFHVKIMQTDEMHQGRALRTVLTADTLKRMVHLLAFQVPSFEQMTWALRIPMTESADWVKGSRDLTGVVHAIQDRLIVTWTADPLTGEDKYRPDITVNSLGALDPRSRRAGLNANRLDFGGEMLDGNAQAMPVGSLCDDTPRRQKLAESYMTALVDVELAYRTTTMLGIERTHSATRTITTTHTTR